MTSAAPATPKLDRRHKWATFVPPARIGRKGEYARLSDGLMFVPREMPFSISGFVFCVSCGKCEVLSAAIH